MSISFCSMPGISQLWKIAFWPQKMTLKREVRDTFWDPLFILGCILDKDTMLVSIWTYPMFGISIWLLPGLKLVNFSVASAANTTVTVWQTMGNCMGNLLQFYCARLLITTIDHSRPTLSSVCFWAVHHRWPPRWGSCEDPVVSVVIRSTVACCPRQ